MADKQANLIIRLKDEASSALSRIKDSYLAVTAAVGGLVAIGVKSLNAFAEEEKEINKLSIALKNQGITLNSATKDIQSYASEIQKTTAFSDTAVIQQASLLTSFGLIGDQMKSASAAARDLSAGLGIDLHTATLLVGKAFQGETGTLARYGIKVQEGKDAAETFSNVLGSLNSRFGGQASAQLDTYLGKVENLKNRFGELAEKLGQELMPVATSWLSWIQEAIGWVEKKTGADRENLSVNELAILQLTEERDAMIEQAELRAQNHDGVVRLTEAERERIVMITDQLNVLRGSLEEEKRINAAKLADAQAKAKARIELEKNANTVILAGHKMTKDEYLKMQNEGYQAFLKNEEAVRLNDEKTLKLRRENFSSTLNFISSLASSKNKELAAIGRAAAIAQATMDTYAAANVALRSAPPPWNFALAALVTTAGLANVAKIAGVQMAEGGVVMPRTGGTMATIGEAGSAEAVIPLGDNRAMEQMREAGLGGNTINISVGTLVGSDGMREFAKMLDQELFSLRRNNESVAFEAL